MADEAKPSESAGAEPHLPIIESPKLAGSDDVATHGADSPPIPEPPHVIETAPAAEAAQPSETGREDPAATIAAAAASESLSRSLRFALLAASVAAAAALGSFVGSLSAAGVTHLMAGAEPEGANATTVNASQAAAATAAAAARAELAELAAVKAGLDNTARAANSQFTKLADRLDRAERVQIESATKIAHVADAMDGLEKRMATAAAAAAAAAAPQTTGSIAAAAPPSSAAAPDLKSGDKVLEDWIVQDVRGGHALIENRHGGIFDVAAGGRLPGLGRVETIKRQNGQWIVVTTGGLITEHN